MWWTWLLVGIGVLIVVVVIYDLTQRQHTLLRNFPIIGHFRYLLEGVGPELRQYIVVDNDCGEAVQPRSAPVDLHGGEAAEHLLRVRHRQRPRGLARLSHHQAVVVPVAGTAPGRSGISTRQFRLPAAKVFGGARGRAHAFRLPSVVNISSMSYGSLGAKAIESLNRGAALAGCFQGTGEGGISPFHRHGGDLVWQIGTGYFGCRDAEGRFDLARFRDVIAAHPQIRMIEIKLSQGAKPGLGGLLPAAKVTREIAAMRGVPEGVDCWSPSTHSAFDDADGLLDFVELLATESGLPVGIKSAVGQLDLFRDLAVLMTAGGRGVDFVDVDGGEGGTGAGPLVFTDHVALPFKVGFSRVYRVFAEAGLHERRRVHRCRKARAPRERACSRSRSVATP